jgi:hypothetical protein
MDRFVAIAPVRNALRLSQAMTVDGAPDTTVIIRESG